MICLDAERTFTNARATTSGSGRSGRHAVVARTRLASSRRRRLATSPSPSFLPRAVPANGSNGSVSSDGVSLSAAVPTTLDALAAATGAGGAVSMEQSSSSSSSFAAEAVPVLQRDSAFFVRFPQFHKERAGGYPLALSEGCREGAQRGKSGVLSLTGMPSFRSPRSLSLPPHLSSTSTSTLVLYSPGYSDFVSHFRTASSYIANHRSKTMVVLLPGEVSRKREKRREEEREDEENRKKSRKKNLPPSKNFFIRSSPGKTSSEASSATSACSTVWESTSLSRWAQSLRSTAGSLDRAGHRSLSTDTE